MIKRLCTLLAVMMLLVPLGASAAHSAQNDGVDVRKIIFEHVKDTYEWHITTVGEKHISISLPIIIYSQRTGWEVFSSAVFHEQESYKGFYISYMGDNEGKIQLPRTK